MMIKFYAFCSFQIQDGTAARVHLIIPNPAPLHSLHISWSGKKFITIILLYTVVSHYCGRRPCNRWHSQVPLWSTHAQIHGHLLKCQCDLASTTASPTNLNQHVYKLVKVRFSRRYYLIQLRIETVKGYTLFFHATTETSCHRFWLHQL